MLSMADQLAAIQRIAAFSVGLRGHQLARWDTAEGFALASCTRCRAELRVYYSPVQPDLDGSALFHMCGKGAVERAA